MSDHRVLLREVENVTKHPNADKLELIKVDGLDYTIISQMGNYKVGDYALIIPDSCILHKDMVDHFELTFLKNREVKTVKIRGIHSQALALPYDELREFSKHFWAITESWLKEFGTLDNHITYDFDFSGLLKISRVKKLSLHTGTILGDLPEGIEKYDLENAERYPDLFEALYETDVVITEKLEGTNFTVHATKDNVFFCSRTKTKRDGLYVTIPQENELDTKLKKYLEENNLTSVTIRGELIGRKIQGNIYDLDGVDYYVFDAKVNNQYLDNFDFYAFCSELNIRFAPIVYTGVLHDYAIDIETLKEQSNGFSFINDTVMREGIVITGKAYGQRVIFKQRSPEYLTNAK